MSKKQLSAILIFILFSLSILFSQNKDLNASLNTAIEVQNIFRKIANDVIPKVVRIDVSVYNNNSKTSNKSFGSGVIIEQIGNDIYVLTNNHVVVGANEINISMSNDKVFKGELVGLDERSDIAVIKFTSTDKIQPAKIGKSSEVHVGDWTIVIGNPFGFNGTFSVGVVSALGRAMMWSNKTDATDFIQTDAAINPGNSGGPLVNIYGEVIALTSWIASQTGANTGLSFAIPIDNAMLIYSKLKKDKVVEYAWLGTGINSLTNQTFRESLGITREHGAYITEIVKDSPAEKSGFKVGDIIIAIDDKSVKDANELIWLISKYNPGDKIKVTLISNNKTINISVILAKRPGNNIAVKPTTPIEITGNSFLGAYYSNIDKNTGDKLKLKNLFGVIITKFDNVSQAKEYGLQVGDIIKKINTTEIKNKTDLDSFIATSDKNKIISFYFYLIRNDRELVIGVQK